MKYFGRIGILAGGPSSEREISLKSGEAVLHALRSRGLDPIFVDLGGDVEDEIKRANLNVAFIVLHGGFGEDGTVQRILKGLKVSYTGSGPEASRLALDKLASRKIFEGVGIDVPKYKVLSRDERFDLGDLNMPLVVKPQQEGSSVGLSVIDDLKEMDDALDKAFAYGSKVIVEEFIKGRELTVGILNDKPLPVIEIVTEKGVM